MSTPQQLDQFINDLQNGNTVSAQSDEETLTMELFDLANSFQLDSDFDNQMLDQFTPQTKKQPHISSRWLRLIATLAIGMMGIMALFASVPALRVLAEDLIAEIFPRKSDTLWVVANEDDRLFFEDDEMESFTTLEDLQAAIDFDQILPDLDEDEFAFSHASLIVPRNTIQANFYQVAGSKDNINLNIKQQPLDDTINGIFYYSGEQNMISPDAETIPIAIGDYTGEIVKGAWTTSNWRDDDIYFRWSNHFPMIRLRWKDDLYIYEIKFVSIDEDAIDTVIGLAESMMDHKQ